MESVIDPSWVSRVIHERCVPVNEESLEKFLKIYGSTYFAVSISDGELSGNYLISLSSV
jgi:hypothetical protein